MGYFKRVYRRYATRCCEGVLISVGRKYSKVSILGGPGSGKSTLARKIGDALGIKKIVHIDGIFHTRADYFSEHQDEYAKLVKQELSSVKAWISEGNYSVTLPYRLSESDLVIFIDLPTRSQQYGVLKRRIQHLRKHREEMPADWRERFSWEFMKFVKLYNSRSRQRHIDLIEQHSGNAKVCMLRSRAEVNDFVNSIKEQNI